CSLGTRPLRKSWRSTPRGTRSAAGTIRAPAAPGGSGSAATGLDGSTHTSRRILVGSRGLSPNLHELKGFSWHARSQTAPPSPPPPPAPPRELSDALDAKDPAARFRPIEPLRPPAGAPNVLIFLLDDVGFGAASAFGGPCATPTAERLAGSGLRYNRFHTTA